MAEAEIEAAMTQAIAAPGEAAGGDVPEGFVPLRRMSGYMAGFGQLYLHAQRRTLAVRIDESHLNNLGIPHGGMLATLADTAIGMMMSLETGRAKSAVTVNLSLDYLDSARLGDWVEARVEFDKLGSRLRYGTCRLVSGERCLLRATAIFAVLAPRT
ncbi:PaaI family thioesterase [Cupriavidus sp. UYPR2.512]|uniref:PaaI family thioesterase n=1 Tax=Cupriavidus sp. UYPR2.512 TaxID=1080187 RepID=UPI00036D4ABB|nr:PaaI family thioesterase [Cupriavidus sp. UYPR2.512]UIF90130.1 PaaI family thioesterase [Cupriavidus necator]